MELTFFQEICIPRIQCGPLIKSAIFVQILQYPQRHFEQKNFQNPLIPNVKSVGNILKNQNV